MEQSVNKMNKRQLQAMNTRKKIHDTALALMSKHGYDNVTINDICKAAGVATGTFYTYFKAKSDIFTLMYVEADQYFASHVAASTAEGTAFERVIKFFIEYARYNENVGLDRVRLLYNPENKWFITKGRQMPEVLKNIILTGQKDGELTDKISADQITEYLFVAARGVMYHWCLHNASFDPKKYMEQFLEFYLKGNFASL